MVAWIGGASSPDWLATTPQSNWSNGSAPTSTDSAVIGGITNATIKSGDVAQAQSLSLVSGSTLTDSGSLTLTSVLGLAGGSTFILNNTSLSVPGNISFFRRPTVFSRQARSPLQTPSPPTSCQAQAPST